MFQSYMPLALNKSHCSNYYNKNQLIIKLILERIKLQSLMGLQLRIRFK